MDLLKGFRKKNLKMSHIGMWIVLSWRQRQKIHGSRFLPGSWKKQESSRKTSISALLTMPKPLTVWITRNWKILKEMGIPDHLTCLLRNLYARQEATVRTRHGTTDCFQIGKGVRQAVYCYSAYLTHMQSTSWETLDWMKHRLESRLPRDAGSRHGRSHPWQGHVKETW